MTIEDQAIPADIVPRMMFREQEGTTFIMLKSEVERHQLDFAFPCRMINLDVHSSLDAVGFIAHVASELAKHEMGGNPVSAFFHDHSFVPDGRETQALKVLAQIAERAATTKP
ncbi:ACT-3 domain-containing protein [Sulfidibacter corallicola]